MLLKSVHFMHRESEAVGDGKHTSPSRRRILKLRWLIFRVGEPGKQFRQLPIE